MGIGTAPVPSARVATLSDFIAGVEQLTRYLELMNRDSALRPVCGIFAAQEIKPQARTLATDRGIDDPSLRLF